MRIGAIINNHWAGEGNPSKYFIYTGVEGDYATGIYLSEGKLKKSKYYKMDFKDREKFEVVGYCEAFDIMKANLREIQLNGGES